MPTNHKRQNPASRGSASELTASPEQPEVATTTTEAAAAPPAPSAPSAPSAPPGEAQQAPSPRPQQGQQQQRRGEGLNIGELKDMSIQKLTQIAKELNV